MKYTYLFVLFCMTAMGQCPEISKQPENQSDCDGNSIRMLCLASSGAKFQWERKRPTDANFTNISGATSGSYQIFPSGDVNNPSGTLYRAKVTLNACTVYSNPAEITLHKISSILNPGICERGAGSLETQIPDASIASANTYQWSRSTDGLTYSDLVDDANFSGSKTKNLRISNALLGLSGQKFKVRVLFSITPNNDNEGSLLNENQTSTCPRTSSEVSLQIKSSPVPVHSAALYKGCLGAPIGINSTGCSPYTTQWYDANQQKIGIGARISVIHSTKTPELYKATCIKSGCESLPSLGTSAQAYDIPSAPMNAGTPSSICPGNSLIFKASGGTNNIWYLNENATSSLSTATSLTVVSTGNSGTEAQKITRWVSQKINECESPRAAIEVVVPPILSASAGQSTTLSVASFYDTKPFVTARGGTPPYRFQWSTSNNTPVISPTDANPKIGPFTTPGFVKISVRDQGNCVAQDSIYISIEAKKAPLPSEPVDPPVSPIAGDPTKPGPVSGGSDPVNKEPVSVGGIPSSGVSDPLGKNPLGGSSDPANAGGLAGSDPLSTNPRSGGSSDSSKVADPTVPLGSEPTNISQQPSSPSASEPIPTKIPEPVIPERTTMSFTKIQHCDTESYDIEVRGCPANTRYYNQYGPEVLIGAGDKISFQVSYEKYITIRCDGGNAEPINLTLEGLQRPQITWSKNFDAFLCAGDRLELKAHLPVDTRFVGWEKDGHIISESAVFLEQVSESGQYQAVVDKLACIHRGDMISVPVHPMAEIPSLRVARQSICVQDSISLSLINPEAFFEWNVAEKSSTILRKANSAGIQSFRARQSMDGYCWSDWSKNQEISVHSLPEKPSILPVENQQMCHGKALTLFANKAFEYVWNTGAKEDSIQVRNSGEFYLQTRNEWGCWSPKSETMQIVDRPNPSKPMLYPIGSFFLQAQNSDAISGYEWTWKDQFLPDSSAKIKTFESGIYHVRAKKKYEMANNPTITCWSPSAQIPIFIQEMHKGFSVYPNPSTGEKIMIEIREDIHGGTLSLIDFRGISMQTWEIADSKDRIEINVQGIKQGEFILRLISPTFSSEKVLYLNP